MASAILGLSRDNITAATASPEFRLGTVGGYDDPTNGYQEFIYGRASGAVTGLGYVVVESSGNIFQHITTANTAAGQNGHGARVGVAQAVMATNQYGWFQVYGKSSLRTAASCARGTRINTTATVGVVDDDGTAGARAINGVVLGTATGGAEATNADAYLSYPTVGATL